MEDVRIGSALGAVLHGCEVVPVAVKAATMPDDREKRIELVGMHGRGASDAVDTVRAALLACRFHMPEHVVVSFEPSARSLPEHSGQLELAIAVAVLRASGQIHPSAAGELYLGELDIDGTVKPSLPGAFAYGSYAAKHGLSVVCGRSCDIAAGESAKAIRSLSDMRSDSAGIVTGYHRPMNQAPSFAPLAAADFPGREAAEEAIADAIRTGGAVLIESANASAAAVKAVTAAVCARLSPLSREESDEAYALASIAGTPSAYGERPFVEARPGISLARLVGGGKPVKPGLATLAHHGVLYLDDAMGFSENHLIMLRTARREGAVTLCRADGTYRMPSEFALAGWANPCPCGRYGHREQPCSCSPSLLGAYRDSLSRVCEEFFDGKVVRL